MLGLESGSFALVISQTVEPMHVGRPLRACTEDRLLGLSIFTDGSILASDTNAHR
jgi:hypothetical protein